MIYSPKDPTTITTLEQLRDFVADELGYVSQDLNDTKQVQLTPVYSAPDKPREGMIIFADGTHYNPGSGGGTYEYFGGAWRKLYQDLTTILANIATLQSQVATLMTPPGSFHVDRNGTNQTVTAGVVTKIQFTHEVLDSSNWFDNSTNYRFTPQTAGTWLIILKTSALGAVGDGAQAEIRKNGSAIAEGSYTTADTTDDTHSIVVALVTFNGSTDFVEGYTYSPTATVFGTAIDTYMQGTKVR